MDTVEQLLTTGLFANVDVNDLSALTEVMEHQHYEPETVLFEAGDEGDAMYIIQAGLVRVYTCDEQGDELTLMHYRASQIFGEFSLLDNEPRSASVSTVEPTDVLSLHRENFLDFLLQRPQVALAMMRNLSQRARYTTRYVEEVMRWTKQLARGEYVHAIEQLSTSDSEDHSDDIQGLITHFLQMVQSVRHREDELKKEVVRLRVQIDQKKRETAVQSITRSDFFARLKEQAKQMRTETPIPQTKNDL